jgi:hypothetical protein
LDPRILFLDDQLTENDREDSLGRYLDVLSSEGVVLVEASDTDVMLAELERHAKGNLRIDGFFIDLMLPHVPVGNGRGRDFRKWGVPSLDLHHDIGGAQVIKLMRHAHYAAQRADQNCPLHVTSYFVDVPIILFTTYEDGVHVAKREEIEQFCDSFVWKDSDNVEQQIIEWVHKLRNRNAQP